MEAPTHFGALRAAVESILRNPHGHHWSIQGFGMMRTYFDKDKAWRLNMWDSSLAVPNVSVIHDHPWHFRSFVLAGKFTNMRYLPGEDGAQYDWQVIRTGPGGGPAGRADGTMRLGVETVERYCEGDIYNQVATEIHESQYEDGTVTLNHRVRLPDGEHARVFWPHGQQWVDAEPRDATVDEIIRVTGTALARWFDPPKLIPLNPVVMARMWEKGEEPDAKLSGVYPVRS